MIDTICPTQALENAGRRYEQNYARWKKKSPQLPDDALLHFARHNELPKEIREQRALPRVKPRGGVER